MVEIVGEENTVRLCSSGMYLDMGFYEDTDTINSPSMCISMKMGVSLTAIEIANIYCLNELTGSMGQSSEWN